MKEKQRTFVATKNLYLYFDEEGWSEDNPTDYGKEYGMTAKQVRDESLAEEIRKGTRFYLKDTEDSDGIDANEFPYCLRSFHGSHVVGLERLSHIDLIDFREEA